LVLCLPAAAAVESLVRARWAVVGLQNCAATNWLGEAVAVTGWTTIVPYWKPPFKARAPLAIYLHTCVVHSHQHRHALHGRLLSLLFSSDKARL